MAVIQDLPTEIIEHIFIPSPDYRVNYSYHHTAWSHYPPWPTERIYFLLVKTLVCRMWASISRKVINEEVILKGTPSDHARLAHLQELATSQGEAIVRRVQVQRPEPHVMEQFGALTGLVNLHVIDYHSTVHLQMLPFNMLDGLKTLDLHAHLTEAAGQEHRFDSLTRLAVYVDLVPVAFLASLLRAATRLSLQLVS